MALSIKHAAKTVFRVIPTEDSTNRNPFMPGQIKVIFQIESFSCKICRSRISIDKLCQASQLFSR